MTVVGVNPDRKQFDWDKLQRLREASSQASKEAIRALQELASFLGRGVS